MCRIDDCDEATVQQSRTIKAARKAHRCSECRRQIEIGESYHYCFMVTEGEAMAWCVCVHCQVATQWLTKNCGGYVFDFVREELEEHAAEYPYLSGPLRALAEAMRERWRDSHGEIFPIPSLPPPINVTESRNRTDA